MVDGTFGAGGYSRAFLAAGARVVAFDRDPSARRFAAALEGETFRLVEKPFSSMIELGPAVAAGVALDLGLSSMQLDEAARGFSLMRDGPLDMRMGVTGRSAADIVNEDEEDALAALFREFGEEPRPGRVAAAIVRRRAEAPFRRTLDLAETVERALGGRRGARTHPATRVFQALRIAVNDELAELETGLGAAERVLVPGGRLAVVSFHSLEDRIVKTLPQDALRRRRERLAPRAAESGRPGAQLPPDRRRRPTAGRRRNPRQSARQIGQAALCGAHRFARLELSSGMIVSDLFDRRYRGFRVVHLAALSLLAVLALGSYIFTTLAGAQNNEAQAVQTRIDQEERRLRLLKAEIAHLEDPGRIERLSNQYLGLQAVNPTHEISARDLARIAAPGPQAATSPKP